MIEWAASQRFGKHAKLVRNLRPVTMLMPLQLKTQEAARKATWLELFYDLIYVIVIAKLTHLLDHLSDGHLSPLTLLAFAALFVPVWWAWTGHTLFSNRFDPDDTLHRVLTLAQMFLAVVMATFIEDAFGQGAIGFALSYAGIRGLLLLMYWRVYVSAPELRPVSGLFLTGFSLGAGLWVLSIFFAPPVMFALWALGLLVDFATPIIGQRRLAQVSVHSAHLPERLGLLTIILLGESVLGVTSGIAEVIWSLQIIAAAVAGFVLLCCLWWLYFESLEHSLMSRPLRSGQLAIYGHLPVYIGLATVAVAILHGIKADIAAFDFGLLLCGGLLLFMVPLHVIHMGQLPPQYRRGFVARAAAITVALLAIAMAGMLTTPVWTLIAATLATFAYVATENRYCLTAESP